MVLTGIMYCNRTGEEAAEKSAVLLLRKVRTSILIFYIKYCAPAPI